MSHLVSIEIDRETAEHLQHQIKKDMPPHYKGALVDLLTAIDDALLFDDALESYDEKSEAALENIKEQIDAVEQTTIKA